MTAQRTEITQTEAETVQAEMETAETITIETESFSAYAIAYRPADGSAGIERTIKKEKAPGLCKAGAGLLAEQNVDGRAYLSYAYIVGCGQRDRCEMQVRIYFL